MKNMVAKSASSTLGHPLNYAVARMRIILVILAFSKLLLNPALPLAFAVLKQSLAKAHYVILKNVKTEFKQKITQSEERIHALEKEIQQLKDKLAGVFSRDLVTQAKTIGKFKILATKVEGLDGKALRNAMDHLKQRTWQCGHCARHGQR